MGVGLTGRGEAETPPAPVSCVTTGHSFPCEVKTPPPPGRYRGLLPPPPEGAGSERRLLVGSRARVVSRLKPCEEEITSRAVYRWGIAPVGEGLTGRGEAETTPPSPVSCVSTGDVFPRRGGEHLPCPVRCPVSTSIPHEDDQEHFHTNEERLSGFAADRDHNAALITLR